MSITKLYLCDKGSWCKGSSQGCCGGECNHTTDKEHSVSIRDNKKLQFEGRFFNKILIWWEVSK